MPTPPTRFEKIADSFPVEAALTYIAAAAGTPIAALLPILGNSIAAERQKKRVEATLQEMNDLLGKHQKQLDNLTDQQYKFINEAILTLLHTTNESKMRMLQNVVQNSLSVISLPDQEAVFLSRIIRDISADEALLLVDTFSYKRIWLSEHEPAEIEFSTLAIKPSSSQGQSILGLFTLGLVANAEPTFDDLGLLKFTPMAAKLITLLRSTNV